MKIKSFKYMGILALTCLMCMCMCFEMCTTASAAEIVPEEITVTPRDGANTVYPGDTLTLNLGTLSLGGNVTLTFVTASEATGGKLSWKFYCGKNQIDSGEIGVNDMIELPKLLIKGTYTVEITNLANKKVSAFAYFK